MNHIAGAVAGCLVLWAAAASATEPVAVELDFQGPYDVVEDGAHQMATLRKEGRSLPGPEVRAGSVGLALGVPVLQFEGGTPDQRQARLTVDPDRPDNQILEFVVREPNVQLADKRRTKSRVQMNVYGNVGASEVYQSVRMRLGPDLSHLTRFPRGFNWFTLSEWWNNAGWTGEPFPFRISVNLASAPPGRGLHLSVHATAKSEGSVEWSRHVWSHEAVTFPVPVGHWMRVEYYFKEGGARDGRFVMRVTPDGALPVIVADVTNFTHHPDSQQLDGLKHLNPLKLYTSGPVTQHVRQQGGALVTQWDDLSLLACDSPSPGAATACAQRMGVR